MEHKKNAQYIENFESNKEKNIKQIEKLKNNIWVKNEFSEKVLVGASGSDARLENAFVDTELVSPLELMIFHNNVYNLKDAYEVSDDVKRVFGDYLESVNVSDESNLLIIKNMGLFSPGRVLDFNPVAGNEELYLRRLSQIYDRITSKSGKKDIEKMKNLVDEHGHIMMSGEQERHLRSQKHYDLETGQVYYNPLKDISKNGVNPQTWSFKQGPIRYIQNSIYRDIYRLIRDRALDENAMRQIPKNTVDRLDFLDSTGTKQIDASLLSDIKDNYMFFLDLYQQSQKNFTKNNSNILVVDKNEMVERLARLRDSWGKQKNKNHPYWFHKNN